MSLPPAARCARAVHEFFAQQRAWGMPGARCTRSLVCSVLVEHTSVVTTGPPESPGIPARNGFNGFLRALPGDRLSDAHISRGVVRRVKKRESFQRWRSCAVSTAFHIEGGLSY